MINIKLSQVIFNYQKSAILFYVISIEIFAQNDNTSKITFTQPFDNRTIMAPVLVEQRNKKLLTWTNCIIYLTAFPLICLCLGTCFFKDNSEEMNKFRIVYFSSWCVVQIPACRSTFHKNAAWKYCGLYIFYYVKIVMVSCCLHILYPFMRRA